MAENNPNQYKEFLQSTKDDFYKQEGFNPEAQYVITMKMHYKSILPNANTPGDWFMDICINILTSEKIPHSKWDTTKNAPQFSLNSRHERTVKNHPKAYIDAVFHPLNLPSKPSDGREVVSCLPLDAVLGEVLFAESRRCGKALVPGGLPVVETAKYMGDTKVRCHILSLVGRSHDVEVSSRQRVVPGGSSQQWQTGHVSSQQTVGKGAEHKSAPLIIELDDGSESGTTSKANSQTGWSDNKECRRLPPRHAVDRSLLLPPSSSSLSSKSLLLITPSSDEDDAATTAKPSNNSNSTLLEHDKKTHSRRSDGDRRKKEEPEDDDRVLKDSSIRIPGRFQLVSPCEVDEYLSSADTHVSHLRREKLYRETEDSPVSIFGAVKPPIRSRGPLIVELDPETRKPLKQ
eukprot:GDKK01045270.1.p1 GENE.GDKK01045270.1~~GDKK01045270.1.p1  ORF type:complete len:444 (+),score=110.24 GDKK01045270.1:125-1333(+)